METSKLSLFFNPFQKIAGVKALVWGLVGLALSVVFAVLSECHCHGMLHYGVANNSEWWCYLTEHIVIWLVPAILFFVCGMIFSHSKIRIIDVFGTTLFAQIPLLPMILCYLLPPMQNMNKVFAEINSSMTQEQIAELVMQSNFISASIILFFSLIFPILMFIWMYKALKVSCNLKGKNLVVSYILSIFVGEVICRLLISMMY